MCGARGIPTTPPEKKALIHKLNAFIDQHDNLSDDNEVGDADDAPEDDADNLNDFVTVESDAASAASDEEADENGEPTGFIESFLEYISDTDEMLVKWVGYSHRYNTVEPCWRLREDLGDPIFAYEKARLAESQVSSS
eukprot:gb/GECG01015976.1/.p1 GENE.gb/GECG01015976.1/~~gb/GECG01015976.1/.p1  ORF type:complete len:138 (+),score=19.74 gb/GECG01015976.1/:1-414(+)